MNVTRDVSDVMHRKCGLRFEKRLLVKFLLRKKTVDFRGSSWPDEFVRSGRRVLVEFLARKKKDDFPLLALWRVPHVVWGRWKSQHRKMFLSPYVESPLNSKVIKSFVPELRSRKCFFVFRDSYVIYI